MTTLINIYFDIHALRAKIKNKKTILKHIPKFIDTYKDVKMRLNQDKKQLRNIRKNNFKFWLSCYWYIFVDSFIYQGIKAFLVGLAVIGTILLATILLKGE